MAVGGAAWLAATRQTGAPAPSLAPGSGTAVAAVGLTDLSRDPAEAWIGPALVEMLGKAHTAPVF